MVMMIMWVYTSLQPAFLCNGTKSLWLFPYKVWKFKNQSNCCPCTFYLDLYQDVTQATHSSCTKYSIILTSDLFSTYVLSCNFFDELLTALYYGTKKAGVREVSTCIIKSKYLGTEPTKTGTKEIHQFFFKKIFYLIYKTTRYTVFWIILFINRSLHVLPFPCKNGWISIKQSQKSLFVIRLL